MSTLLEMPGQTTKALTHTGKRAWTFAVLACLLFAGISSSRSLWGQGITGSITGTVTDETGATIPGATVTVRQVETNATRIVTSSDAGTYTVTQLPPGSYQVKVDKATFKTYQRDNITLQINQTAEINAQLTVGAQTETVLVTAEAPAIQTETSSVGLVVDSQTITNTPLNGRLSLIGLIALAPGVQGAGAQDQLAVRGVTPSIGTGSRNAYGGMGSTLDGVTNQEVTLQRAEAEVPSLDALSEFKVLTNGVPAEFNQPSQVIVVTKGGTNALHGEALEFNRSKGTSAKEYFAGALPRAPYQRNEYGANLSGPIYIPKVYNGKDRSFFFFAFEGFHLTQSSNVNSQQPTTAMRNGDFTAFLPGGACATGGGTVLKNPLTGQGFSTPNVIPQSMLNSVDLQLQQILYPVPTTSGCGTNTFELVPFTSKATRYSVRIDHKINDNNQLRFTFLKADYGPNPDVGTSSLAGGFSGDGEHNSQYILGWTHTFNPSLLIDTYASFFHLPIYRTPQNVNSNFSAIIPGLGPELIQGAPQITITNITSVAEQGSKDLEQVVQANTAVTKVLAKHTVKAGFSFLWDNHWNDSAVSPQRGSYAFTGRYSGNAYADFLLGYPNTTGKPSPNNYITKNLSNQYGLFVQDDWKLKQNLTINMGLRYDLQWFKDNPYGNNSLFVPSLGKVVVFGTSYPPSAIPGFLTLPITLSSQVGLPNNVFAYLGQSKKNVAPRFGFAYQPIPNTVVRGAFGIFFNLLPASYVGVPFSNLPFSGSQTFSQPASGPPAFSMSNPFTATGAFAANPAASAQHSTVTPYTEGYNLAVEQQLPKGIGVRIGYVGQRNIKQNNSSGSGNYAPDINLNTPQVGVNPQTRRFVQPFAAITQNLTPIFHSSMNSLQIGAHKQYSNGFMVNAEYQWIRVIGTENLQDPSGSNVQDSYGNIGGLTPQVFVVSYSYLLPFGRGQALFGGVSNLANKFISGWQISGITTFQAGQPFSVQYTAPGSPIGLVSCASSTCRASRAAGGALYPSNKNKAQWFNPNAFMAPVCYNSQGSGPCSQIYSPTGPATFDTYGNSAYNMLWGPHLQNWDMNLEKNTVWKERYRLQLRADAFNIFNHPNFAVPNSNITNSNVGTITAIASGSQSRKVEFGVKFSF